MALTDFLQEGAEIPQGSALKATTSQTVLPDWYSAYAQNLLAGQQALSAQPYQPFPGPRVAGFTPDQTAGFDMSKTAATAYQPGMSAAYGAAASGINGSSLGVANPMFTQAAGMSGATAAYPYLSAAGGSAADVGRYMSPYMDSVVKRIGDLGTRNLTENLLPAIEGRYIGAGQFGSSGQMTDTARALRDISADTLAQQNAALNQGYQTAQQTALADLSRYGQIGATMGSLTGADASRLGDIGSSMGSLASGDYSRALSGANTMAGLAGMSQQYGLTGANAVQGVGAQQQGLDQKNLDTAYADFLRQQGYPQDQIAQMLNVFKGTSTGVPTATQEYGIVPSGVQPEYKPSTASTIASTLLGLGGLISGFKGL